MQYVGARAVTLYGNRRLKGVMTNSMCDENISCEGMSSILLYFSLYQCVRTVVGSRFMFTSITLIDTVTEFEFLAMRSARFNCFMPDMATAGEIF